MLDAIDFQIRMESEKIQGLRAELKIANEEEVWPEIARLQQDLLSALGVRLGLIMAKNIIKDITDNK